MSNYFENFPVVDYRFGNEKTLTQFQHIGTAVDILEQVRKYEVYYINIEIQNGERPDQLSYRLYETPNYYWTFFLLNDHLRTNGWPIRDADVWPKAQEYYPNTVIQTYGVTQDKAPRLFDDGDKPKILWLAEGDQKPLAQSTFFVPGNYVWFQNSYTAGKILSVDPRMGTITTDAKGVRGAEQVVEVIDEVDAAIVLNDPKYIPQKRYAEMEIARDKRNRAKVIDEFDAPHHYQDYEGNWIYPKWSKHAPYPLIHFKDVPIEMSEAGGYEDDSAGGPGPWVTVSSDINTINSVSNYQRLVELNRDQKTISVIKKDSIRFIVREFNNLLKQG
jgi:hypothetical protein